MPDVIFTIFTPTYNSARFIHRVYESVAGQTFRDFEWLVIDDASRDKTLDLLRSYAAKADFPMRIIIKDSNSGLFDSYNTAIREARGEFFVGAGHDDRFDLDSLQFFSAAWQQIPAESRHRYCGITVRCRDELGLTTEEFPTDGMDSNFLEMYFHYRKRAEQWTIYRTNVLRQYPFPAQYRAGAEGALVWFPMAKSYQSRYFNRALRVYYRDNVSSITRDTDPTKYALAMAESNRKLIIYTLEHPKGTIVEAFLCAARYIRFSVHLDKKLRVSLGGLEGQALILGVLSVPLALLMVIRDRLRHARHK